MVLLCKALRQSNDSLLSNMAFQLVDHLQSEKEVLITKAISWILRSLIKYHPKEVSDYMAKNIKTLPRLALREATHKLLTGVKTPRRQKKFS